MLRVNATSASIPGTYDRLRLYAREGRAAAPVPIQGGKTAFNHMAAVGLLGHDMSLTLHNAPMVSDRLAVAQLCRSVGVAVDGGSSDLRFRGNPRRRTLDLAAGRRFRASICYAAALASNMGSSVAAFPGGDTFTDRPIDVHFRVLEAAGARCRVDTAPRRITIEFAREPRPFSVSLRTTFGPSVGATVTALLVAARASGVSTLTDVSREPEVAAVAKVLRAFGVAITSEGDTLIVEGNGAPLTGAATVSVPPDRIEAGTYIFVGLLLHGTVTLERIHIEDFPCGFLEVMEEVGVRFRHSARGRIPTVTATLTDSLRPVSVRTAPHPGYPSDLQPPLSVFLSQIDGVSRIAEDVYTSRVTHVPELAKLGVHVRCDGYFQQIRGPQGLIGGEAEARDIRCGGALIVAGAAAASHTTILDRGRHLARGYGMVEEKLRLLGLCVTYDQIIREPSS